MSMKEMVWEDPPEDGRVSFHHQVVAELKAHPGKWARIATEVSHGYVSILRRGSVAAYRPTENFEFASRNQRQVDGHRRADVYGRYVGNQDGESS